jgi:hypothetical protein
MTKLLSARETKGRLSYNPSTESYEGNEDRR